MSNFTYGKLSVSVVRVDTTASLTEIADAMSATRPHHATLAPGWGSILDDGAPVGTIAGPPSVFDPMIDPEQGIYPERLFARLYYWTPDPGARRLAGAQADLREVSRLRACDFLMSRISEDTLMVAMSSRTRAEQDRTFKPALTSLFHSMDSKSNVWMDSSPLDLVDHDIFMWLLHRLDNDRQLSPQLELLSIREITSQDTLSRGANLSQGVDLTRRELRALITNDSIRFGPAKLRLSYAPEEVALDFELYVDGGFSVHSTETHYRHMMSRATIGPRAVVDLIFGVVPELRRAFRDDDEWSTRNKPTFITECLDALQGRLVSADVCPHCGEPLTV